MKYKNPFDIIEIKRRIKNKNVKFIVAGGGELSTEFREVAKEEEIQYLGKIDEKTKIELYRKSWVILSTSFIEGWGMAIVEANSCGTPAIAYSTGSLPEIIKQGINGFVIPYKDVNTVARYIDYIKEDENIMKELPRKSYEESLKYDWNKTAEEYRKYIENIYYK
jgi:glycosyltransferase involved in cell wall biosynthesis